MSDTRTVATADLAALFAGLDSGALVFSGHRPASLLTVGCRNALANLFRVLHGDPPASFEGEVVNEVAEATGPSALASGGVTAAGPSGLQAPPPAPSGASVDVETYLREGRY